MKLIVKPDRSISAGVEAMENLMRANTSREIIYALNGYTLLTPTKTITEDLPEMKGGDFSGASTNER